MCGRTVRTKRLLRAAQPVGLSSEDLSHLRAHNLKYIFDLRTRHEVELRPVDRIDGVTYTHIDIIGDSTSQAALPSYWMKLFRKDPDGTEGEFLNTYRDFATTTHASKGYASMLKKLAATTGSDGAALFHCAAGKDRTGFAAAIILKILGVRDDDVFADYLRTREYQAHVQKFYEDRARLEGFSDEQIRKMNSIFGVNLNYLTAALEAAKNTYGSFESYVTNGLGITEEDAANLKRNFLE